MNIIPIKTDPITTRDSDLLALLDRYLPSLQERSILAVTSKVVAICEGRVVPIEKVIKSTLIEEEAEYFLPPTESKYGLTLTIRHDLLVPTAGIDESNSDGHFVLWPSDPQASANGIRRHLAEHFSLCEMGVLITDSTSRPLRLGVTGVALAHSGFLALNDYVGRPDIFGRPLAVTKANVRDALAAAAVLVMGEGDEQTPLALIADVPFVSFQARDPTEEELTSLHIALADDLYAPLLTRAPWQEGGNATSHRG